MNPCVVCGGEVIPSTCPGHLEPTGVEDHCQLCVDAGRCSAVELEKRMMRDGHEACLGPCESAVQGYPISKSNI